VFSEFFCHYRADENPEDFLRDKPVPRGKQACRSRCHDNKEGYFLPNDFGIDRHHFPRVIAEVVVADADADIGEMLPAASYAATV
jgi:hypothetical protein